MKFILGTKQKMTQVFTDDGQVFPATIINAGPIKALQVKTNEKDGYEAVQFGFGDRKITNIAKPQLGVFKDLGNFRFVRECRGLTGLERGTEINVSAFSEGDKVTVTATSKGKGFQGTVKRHGFKGGPRSHGQKHNERMPGSIGGSGGRAGGRVAKGMRMAGRMGSDRITVKNLTILKVDSATNTILISGAVPGSRGTLVEILGN